METKDKQLLKDALVEWVKAPVRDVMIGTFVAMSLMGKLIADNDEAQEAMRDSAQAEMETAKREEAERRLVADELIARLGL